MGPSHPDGSIPDRTRPAYGGWFSRYLDRARAGGSAGSELAVRNSRAQRLSALSALVGLPPELSVPPGRCRERDLARGVHCSLPPVSKRTFHHHGSKRGNLVGGQCYLAQKLAPFP